MPSIEPVRWAHPDTAPDALRQLLDRGGIVENLMVRLAPPAHFPLRGPRYRLARYALIRDAGWWVDVVTQRPLYGVIGFRRAE